VLTLALFKSLYEVGPPRRPRTHSKVKILDKSVATSPLCCAEPRGGARALLDESSHHYDCPARSDYEVQELECGYRNPPPLVRILIPTTSAWKKVVTNGRREHERGKGKGRQALPPVLSDISSYS
jgi:hypothetical protein